MLSTYNLFIESCIMKGGPVKSNSFQVLITIFHNCITLRGVNFKENFHSSEPVYIYTADFMKKVPSVYTPSMKTIYLSLSAQVAEETIFKRPPVLCIHCSELYVVL